MSLQINSKSMAVPTRAFFVAVIGTLIATLFSIPVLADTPQTDSDSNTGIARLFASDSLLPVSIEAPLTTLMRDLPEEEYLDGKFSFSGDDETKQTVDLKIRTRGKYRRQKKHCDFAPIRLNFVTEQVRDTVFAGQDKLKVVTHCRNNRRDYEQLVLREYLAYRILNVMTNKSFGVRLLQINYVDTEGAKPMARLGFIIEDDDDVAERNGMVAIKTGDISSDDLDRRQQNLIHVFEYLIGNTEYSLFIAEPGEHCCHNADLMSATEGPPFVPLAYDFDFAGIVNAPYAQPNPRYKLRNVRQRLYKGRCRNNILLPDTIQRFLDKKDAIYGIVDELELLSSKSKRSVTRYLNSFYKNISRPKSVNTRFINKCIDEV